MARRLPTVGIEPILASLAATPTGDEVEDLVLDATLGLLMTHGLRRWSIEDVADAAGLGRTTVYRRFGSRDVLVHATLARELRTFFVAIAAAVADFERLEDRVVEGMLTGLHMASDGVLMTLVRSDPATFLPLLTIDAGPLVTVARDALVELAVATGDAPDPDRAAAVAETLVRLAISFLITPSIAFSLDSPTDARAVLHTIVDPLVASSRE